MRAADPGRGEFGAECYRQECAPARQPVDQPAENIEGRWVNPMCVLQQHQDRELFGQPVEQREQRRNRLLLPVGRGKVKLRVSLLTRDRQ